MAKVVWIHAALANPLGSPQPTGPGEKAVAKGVRIGSDWNRNWLRNQGSGFRGRKGRENWIGLERPGPHGVEKGVRIGSDWNASMCPIASGDDAGRKEGENWIGLEPGGKAVVVTNYPVAKMARIGSDWNAKLSRTSSRRKEVRTWSGSELVLVGEDDHGVAASQRGENLERIGTTSPYPPTRE